MDIHHYPLVCWSLPDDHVVGRVVGVELQLIAATAKRVKQSLSKELQRRVNAEPDRYQPPIRNPQIDVVRVSFRPAYRDPIEGTFPAGATLTLPVVAVHGDNDFGAFTCHLPTLGEEFHYYKPGQLEVMVEHFARNRFQALPPEELHRLLMAAAPWLELVSVKMPSRTRKKKGAFGGRPGGMETLGAVAERHPLPRDAKRALKAFPVAAWERDDLVRLAASRLAGGSNLLVVGERGVGKSAVLQAAIEKVHEESKTKERPGGKGFWRTDPHRLIAGAKWLGDWQEIVEQLVFTLQVSGDALWLTDFVGLLRTGGGGPEDSIASYLAPALDRGELQIVAEATPSELEAARTLLPGFLERFQIVRVPELPKPAMFKVLDQLARHARVSMKVEIEREAIEAAHRLLNRYVPYEKFPGKAVKFLAGCVSEAWLTERHRVLARHVIDAFAAQTGMPELFLRDDVALDADGLRAHFTAQILGQEEAVEKVARVVKVFKAGLNDPGKPIAVMLFAGPTGVGKTATARALAEYFFGSGQRLDPLIRLDMSEFQHPAQVERLIGSGTGDPGKLVQHVRERPFSVVLLDEIEKAHPLFFDALLTVMDEGRLVDAYGRLTDFRNTIVVMTTNLGTRRTGSLGFGRADDAGRIESDIRAFFRPEFYNRIDQVVQFRALDEAAVKGIARKELAAVARREGFEKRKLAIEFDEAVVALVAEAGFDPVYGARPLQRVIEKSVVGPLARWLLKSPKATGRVQVRIEAGAVTVDGGS